MRRLMLLVLASVLPLLWASNRIATIGSDSLRLAQHELQIASAHGLARQTAIYREGVRSQVKAVARTLELNDSPTAFTTRLVRRKDLRAIEQHIQEQSSLVYLTVLTPDGVGVQAGVDLRGDEGLRGQVREAFERCRHGVPTVSASTVSTSLGGAVVVFGEPVAVGSKVEGVVIAIAGLGPLVDLTKAAGGGRFEAYIIDESNRLIAHSGSARLLSDVASLEIVRVLRASPQHYGATPFSLPGQDGPRKLLGAFAAVPDDSGWGVVVQAEEETAYLAARDFRSRSVTLAVLMTALTLILSTLVTWRIVRSSRKTT